MGVTVTVHNNTIDADVLGSTAIIVASKSLTTKIRVTNWTKVRLHILTTKTTLPIWGSLEYISGTNQGGRQVRGIETTNTDVTIWSRRRQMKEAFA